MERVVTLTYSRTIRLFAAQLRKTMEAARGIGCDSDWQKYCLEMAPFATDARARLLFIAEIFETDESTVIKDIVPYMDPGARQA